VSFDRGELLRRFSAALGTAAFAGLAPTDAHAAATEARVPDLPPHPRWRFSFISHLTTSPLFVPLQYGIQDACALVRCDYRWTGSARGDTGEVVKALQSAVRSKADAIALPMIDREALKRPVDDALKAGIPVVAYHADAQAASRTLPFVGQDSYGAGVAVGRRIAKLVSSGDVTLLVAGRGVPPVEGRLQGALAGLRKAAPGVHAKVVSTTRDPYEVAARVERQLSESKLRGLFALEFDSSEGVQRAADKHDLRAKGVRAGGYGVLPTTLDLIRGGKLDFTLDEQPYLQGFVPAVQLLLVKLSGGLVEPANTALPLVFVTKANLRPYLAKTRYEGSSSKQRYPIV
jgi:simple sugar transport system substrate-binding protein